MHWSRSRPGPSSAECPLGCSASDRVRVVRRRAVRQTAAVLIGPIIIIVVLLAIPVAVFMIGAVLAAILGTVFTKDVAAEFEGTEYLELS
jgi:hypothetical protein